MKTITIANPTATFARAIKTPCWTGSIIWLQVYVMAIRKMK
jgi:hypothetical protein